MKFVSFLAISGIAGLLLTVPTLAKDHQVEMLNKDSAGRTMQFEPAFIHIEPGDTITFVPTNKSHDSEAIPALIPPNAEPWKGKINEQITASFDEPGYYVYKCTPHLGMGMIGLVQVGEPAAGPSEQLDAAAIGKLPKKARDRLDELFAEAQSAE